MADCTAEGSELQRGRAALPASHRLFAWKTCAKDADFKPGEIKSDCILDSDCKKEGIWMRETASSYRLSVFYFLKNQICEVIFSSRQWNYIYVAYFIMNKPNLLHFKIYNTSWSTREGENMIKEWQKIIYLRKISKYKRKKHPKTVKICVFTDRHTPKTHTHTDLLTDTHWYTHTHCSL